MIQDVVSFANQEVGSVLTVDLEVYLTRKHTLVAPILMHDQLYKTIF